jgi:hypothetical protein
MKKLHLLCAASVVIAVATGGTVAWAAGASGPTSGSPAQPMGTARAGVAAAVPLDSAVGSTFTPLASSCRAADTRVSGGRLGAGAARTFYIGGTTGFAPQGGLAGGCGVPATATAVSVTLTTVSPSGAGYLRTWKPGTTEPATSFMNYGTAFNVAVSGTVLLDTSGRTEIRSAGSSTQLVIDITGYFMAPMRAAVNSSGNLVNGSRVTSSFLISPTTSSYEVDFDRDVSQCSYSVSSYFSGYTLTVEPRSGTPNGVYVFTSYGGTATADQFYLTVTC